MTPTKEVPTWEELVERAAADLYDINKDFDEMTAWRDLPVSERHDRMNEVSLVLRAAGLTPEILEDARAVRAIRERAEQGYVCHTLYAPTEGPAWYQSFFKSLKEPGGTGRGPTLREAVAKAKEAG